MYFHRIFGNVQRSADFLVPQTFGDVIQHLQFAFAERDAWRVFSYSRRHRRRNVPLADLNFANGLHQFFPDRIFEQITSGSSFQSAVNVLVSFVSRQHDDPSARKFSPNLARRFHAA